MRALRFDGSRLEVADVSKPAADGEALVRVLRSGICNTDLEIARGYAGFTGTLGHEFVGIVEAANDRPEMVGKRVVGEINAGCGGCELCLAGDPRHCPHRTVLGIVNRDGAHADFLTLPLMNLLAVPDGVSDRAAVFVEPLAAAYGITECVEIAAGSKIAIVGDGKLGLLCARAMRLRFDDVSLIGKHPSKLELAAKSGIKTSLTDDSRELAGSFDVIIEASGSESGFASALDLVRPRGTIVLKSTFHGQPSWDASRVVVNEISVVGSRCGRFEPVLALLSSNQIEVEDLISDEFSLSDGIEAFRRASEKGVLKVLLNMER